MKPTTTLAIIWIAVSVAVIAAIFFTGKVTPLWAFVIPAMIEIKSSEGEVNGDDEEETDD